MKIFLKDEIHPKAVEYLREKAEIISDWERFPEVDAVLVRKIQLNGDMLDKAENLKVIGFHGSGMNGVDLEAAKNKGVEVFAVPGLNAEAVAEMNVALALDTAHMITQAAVEIKNGRSMQDGLHRFRGSELKDKTAGIIGMGAIGTLTARMLKECFQMKVLGYSRSFSAEKAEQLGITAAGDMAEVLEQSDFIFLAIPYTPETEHIIDENALRKMKPTAVLINTARGKLVKEEALYRALCDGTIKAAACDVFEKEPVEPDNPLVKLTNFIPTPHIGGNTEEALYRVGMGVAEGIVKRLEELQLQAP